jgi:Fe2+ transport system protein FeoA
MSSAVVPLESLQPEERGRICHVDGDDHLVHRLEEMGIREGAQVRMVQSGRPCIVHINENRLSLRSDGAVTILVELDAA